MIYQTDYGGVTVSGEYYLGADTTPELYVVAASQIYHLVVAGLGAGEDKGSVFGAATEDQWGICMSMVDTWFGLTLDKDHIDDKVVVGSQSFLYLTCR